eukprot:g4037.t1
MGIKGLFKLLDDAARERKHLKDIPGKTVGIDAPIYMYKGKYGALCEQKKRQNGKRKRTTEEEEECTQSPNKNDYDDDVLVAYMIRLAESVTKCGKIPFFVFDGACPTIKHAEMQKRWKRKKSAANVAAEPSSPSPSSSSLMCRSSEESYEDGYEDAAAAGGGGGRGGGSRPSNVHVTGQDIDRVVGALLAKGVNVSRAPDDAEKVCAMHFDITLSEDSDALPYGAKILCRQWDNYTNEVDVYDSKHAVSKQLGLSSRAQFVDLCLLLGSDLCPHRLKALGSPEKILGLIQSHKSVERICDVLQRRRGRSTLGILGPPSSSSSGKQRCPLSSNDGTQDSSSSEGAATFHDFMDSIRKARVQFMTSEGYPFPTLLKSVEISSRSAPSGLRRSLTNSPAELAATATLEDGEEAAGIPMIEATLEDGEEAARIPIEKTMETIVRHAIRLCQDDKCRTNADELLSFDVGKKNPDASNSRTIFGDDSSFRALGNERASRNGGL